MSEGLEALERVVEWFEIENVKDIEIIEKELKEYEWFEKELEKYHIRKPFLKEFLDLLSHWEIENVVCLVHFLVSNNISPNEYKNKLKALETIKELFEFDFALRYPNNQPMLMVINKYGGSYFEIPISKDKYDLLKEVML